MTCLIQFCERIAQEIQSYVDGQLASPNGAGLDRESIEAHVRACTFCGAEAHRLASARDMVAGAVSPGPSQGPPPTIWNAIEASLRADGLIRDGEA
ncbi:hypothetical protein HY251_08165 [bacterium]|nr:hypothetical protein [bacterium]